jgi:hypothetical protein
LQNVVTSSFIALSSELWLELILSICEGKKYFSSAPSTDAVVTLVELVIQFTKC